MLLAPPHFHVQPLTLHPCHHTAWTEPDPFSKGFLLSFPEAALTDHFNFVCRVDFSNLVEHPAGVLPTVLWLQVLQVQRPLLLLVLPNLLGREGLVVLQPCDVRPGVATGHALEADGAADGAGDHPPSHLGRLSEPGPGCKKASQWAVVSTGHEQRRKLLSKLTAKFAGEAAPHISVCHSPYYQLKLFYLEGIHHSDQCI